MTGLEKVIGVAIMGAVGAGVKYKTKLPHKATGAATNVALGQAIAGMMGGTPVDGVHLAVLTEAGLNFAKGLYHAGGFMVRGARALFH